MSAAWQSLETRLVRVERRVQKATAGVEEIPPGMMVVLLYGIAVHLGGFPTPLHPQSIWEADEVFVAADRALGYPDAAERRSAGVERDEEWLQRFAGAADRLCDRLNFARNASIRSEGTLVTFVRMLEGIHQLEPSWQMPPNWPGHPRWSDIDTRMDEWIRGVGFSPEAVRRKARGT